MEVLNPIPTQVKKIIAIVLIVVAVFFSVFVGFAELEESMAGLSSFLPKDLREVFEDDKISQRELFTVYKLAEETADMIFCLLVMLAVAGTGVFAAMQTWNGGRKGFQAFPALCLISLVYDLAYIAIANDQTGFKFLELKMTPFTALLLSAISCVFTMAVAKDVQEGRAADGAMTKEDMGSMMNAAKEKASQAASKAGQAASAAGAVASAATEAAKTASQEQKAKQGDASASAFCPHCGKSVKAGAAFCSSCGKSAK